MIVLVISIILLITYLIPRYNTPIVIPDFISPSERNYIIKQASSNLVSSKVGTNQLYMDKSRISETAFLDTNDTVVKGVIQRCASLTDRPLKNCEKLQVTHYKPGGYYKPHQDVIDLNNYRLYTIILALNEDYEGGETVFPNLGKEYKLKAGEALFFHTLDNYELMTSKALHGGKPVKSGEKWICNLWVHKYPYTS
jgi:predicted 2-oxoglutarate/Fe(II)-dependent dioxygenase YbiX